MRPEKNTVGNVLLFAVLAYFLPPLVILISTHLSMLLAVVVVLLQQGGWRAVLEHGYDPIYVSREYVNRAHFWFANQQVLPVFTHAFPIIFIPMVGFLTSIWRAEYVFAWLRDNLLYTDVSFYR